MDALSERFGVSRHPVMEAMKRLAAEGFIDIIPQVGCRVARVDGDAFDDHFRLLAVTDGLLAELAAERRDEAQIVELLAASEGVRALLFEPDSLDFNRYRSHNRALHNVIHTMARAPSIVRVADSISLRADFQVSVLARDSFGYDMIRAAQDEHDEVAQLITRGKARPAGQAMRDHIFKAGARLRTEFQALLVSRG